MAEILSTGDPRKPPMIRIAITPTPSRRIAATLPLGSVGSHQAGDLAQVRDTGSLRPSKNGRLTGKQSHGDEHS